MNLFLVKKTTPLKSKLAKIFAIFLVCFFIGTSAKISLAKPENSPTATLPSNSSVGLTGTNGISTTGPQGLASTQWMGTQLSWDATRFNAIGSSVGTYSETNGVGSYASDIEFVTMTERVDGTATPVELGGPSGATTVYQVDRTTGLASRMYGYTNANGTYVPFVNPNDVGPQAVIDAREAQKLISERASHLSNPDGSRTPTQQAASRNETSVAGANQAATAGADAARREKDMTCGAVDIVCMLTKAVYYITIQPASWLLIASGWFLDFTVTKTIVEFQSTIKNGGNQISFYSVIKLVWSIFRDMINMSFIFLLLYASIMTILKAETSGLKKTIGNIIIVALLINFSLFFVEVVIDISNNAAVTIYNAITQAPNAGQRNNLADAFMKNMSLETLFTTAKGMASGGTNFTGMLAICIFGSVFILILAVVFFIMAILFAVRFVEFIILMMMSPIGFATRALPKLNDAFDGSFWKNLISQAFFAPIMFFFLWISIKLLGAINTLGGKNANLSAMFQDGKAMAGNPSSGMGGIGAYILGYFVLIFMLIKGMELAKKMSATGAKSLQSGFLKYSGANLLEKKLAPKSIAGGVARQTLGWGATRFADSAAMRGMQTTAIGRFLKDKSLAVGKAGFGEKKGFSQNEADRVKRLGLVKDSLEKKTSAEEAKIDEHKQRVWEAQKPRDALKAHVDATEALDLADGHMERKTDILKQKAELEEKIAGYEKLLPVTKEDTAKLASFDKQIKETDDVLKKSFKKANIQLNDVSEESIKKASDEAKKKKAEAVKSNPDIDFNKNQTELKEVLEKIESHTKDQETELKKVEETIKLEAKNRVTKYTTNLTMSRPGNLFLPSKAAKEAGLKLRNELRKGEKEKTEDKNNATMKKIFKEAFKEESKAAEAPKEKPKE